MPQARVFSPFGILTLTEEDGALVALDWGEGAMLQSTALLTEAGKQLEAYFSGSLRVFDLPLNPHGTAFQTKVWQALRDIPYGSTRTYGDLARDLKSAPRAVGGACGANPIPIIIPCHRVLGAGRALGGYSGDGGIETKAKLLAMEGMGDIT